MSKKKKLNIKTLNYPNWFNILFFYLTVVTPIILIIVEGMKAPNTPAGTVFKVSFTSICILLVTWVFIKKLILNGIITKLISRQEALKHDYSIDNGNLEKIKYLWYQAEKKLTLYNLVSIILYGGLSAIILIGVASALMEIKGVIMIITSLYVIAYTIKFMVLIIKGGDSDEIQDEPTES